METLWAFPISNGMNKKTFSIVSVIVAVLIIGAWWWSKAPVSQAPNAGEPSQDTTGIQSTTGAAIQSDTTGIINQDLQNITVEDPDFQSIDSDVDSL